MIIVTGGSGKAGRARISELLAHNYEVASVDLVRAPDLPVPFSRVELTDSAKRWRRFPRLMIVSTM
jgi:nucleoside-diphosphate-sugar epimerase